jgi:peptidoglycan/LPS O-acetylase OafA/YrhL
VALFLALSVVVIISAAMGAFPHPQLIMFASGMLLFEAIHEFHVGERVPDGADYVVLATVLVTLWLSYVLWDRRYWLSNESHLMAFGGYYRHVALFLGFFAFTLACFRSQGLLARLFCAAPIRWLGNMSYSYYLIHGLTLHGLRLTIASMVAPGAHPAVFFWLGMPVAFGCTLVVSAALFVTIERRFSLVPASPTTSAAASGPVSRAPEAGRPVPFDPVPHRSSAPTGSPARE